MCSKENVQQFMNMLACALSIVNEFDKLTPRRHFNEITALEGYEIYANETKELLDTLVVETITEFLTQINKLIEYIEKETIQEKRYVTALELCKWMDLHISYLQPESGDKKISMSKLFAVGSNNFAMIKSLNSNYEDTKIWINPRFPVYKSYIVIDGKEEQKSLANRDAFEGANGFLKNCSFIEWTGEKTVTNIMLPNDNIFAGEKKTINIAFAPISDKSNLVCPIESVITRFGMKQKGIEVNFIGDEGEIENRIKKDLELACRNNVDILFMPELIGTKRLYALDNAYYNTFVYNLGLQLIEDDLMLPSLIILPSIWENGHNIASLVFHDGRILGNQEKFVPFVDEKNHAIEALSSTTCQDTVVIHIPNVGRIAVLICADFLAIQPQQTQEFICGQLGATLLIVPSYSSGEQDFINCLSSLKSYGTTVVWGNCCGAARSNNKCIGGCGIAGTSETILFGNLCECNNSCEDIDACLFLVGLPWKQEVIKLGDSKAQITTEHIIK